MSLPLVINGVTYNYPQVDDVDWGPDATDWASAVTTGMLQKAGGLFQLLAEVDFGTSFGVKSLYYKSRTSNPATAGQVRLARADVVSWRNQANSANLDLAVNSSNVLTFNGSSIQNQLAVSDTSTIDLTLLADTLSADIIAGSITNSLINASAAIAFSKLAALSSGNILVGSAGNVATSVAMSGDVTISNTGAAAIGANKVLNSMLAQMAQSTFKGRAASSSTGDPVDLTATQATAILNSFVGDSGSGGTKGLVPAPITGDATKFLSGAGTWGTPSGAGDVVGPGSSTNNGFAKFDGTTGKLLKNSAATLVNADIDAAAAIAYSKLALTGGIVNADISASAAIAFSKLANLTSAHILVGSAGNVATDVAVTGDISLTNAGVTAYSGTVPLNKGGTGQTTKAPAFDALSPMTTGGDLIYGGASGTGTRLANGSAGNFLKSAGGTSAPTWSAFTPPTIQKFTSSTGTYTTVAGALYIRIVMVGGGGGGAGGGISASAGSGGTGGNTTFGTTLLVASGGVGATNGNANGGAGGAASLGSGPVGIAVPGGSGQGTGQEISLNGMVAGGMGASSALGGGGGGGKGNTGANGQDGSTNSGGGGGGGGTQSNGGNTMYGGSGGGSGGYLDAIITSPSATYAYAVGAAGTAGTAGTTGNAGGAGAAGQIIVYEYYQ